MLDERKWSPGGLEFQKMVIPRYVVFVYLRHLRSVAPVDQLKRRFHHVLPVVTICSTETMLFGLS